MEGGVITWMKKRYWCHEIERDTDLTDFGITKKFYKIDINEGVRIIYNNWDQMDGSIIENCWIRTRLITEKSIISRTNQHTAFSINSGTVLGILLNLLSGRFQ